MADGGEVSEPWWVLGRDASELSLLLSLFFQIRVSTGANKSQQVQTPPSNKCAPESRHGRDEATSPISRCTRSPQQHPIHPLSGGATVETLDLDPSPKSNRPKYLSTSSDRPLLFFFFLLIEIVRLCPPPLPPSLCLRPRPCLDPSHPPPCPPAIGRYIVLPP